MSSPVVSVKVIGFLSLFLILTLNGRNGTDILDGITEWLQKEVALEAPSNP